MLKVDPEKHKELLLPFLKGKRTSNAVSELVGIASLVVFDGHLGDDEISFLRVWIGQHQEFSRDYPISELVSLFSGFGSTDPVSDDLRNRAYQFLLSISPSSEEIDPLDAHYAANPVIRFDGKTFVFTGDLEYCDRRKAESAVLALGGLLTESGGYRKNVDYLVVGKKGSSMWANGKFGSKIKSALKDQTEKKSDVILIREDDFVKAMLRSPGKRK